MTLRRRRIFAALIDAAIVALIDVLVLLLFGHDTIASLAHGRHNMATTIGSMHLTATPAAMLFDWLLVCFTDGLVVFIQPLALLSTFTFSFSIATITVIDQLWLISAVSLLANALYRIGMEASPLNASIGMRLFHLRVAYGRFTLRRNPFVRHFAKILTMPVVLGANLVGVPITMLMPAGENDLGYYIMKAAGETGEQLLHDEIASVKFEECEI